MIINEDYKNDEGNLKYVKIEFEKIHSSSLEEFNVLKTIDIYIEDLMHMNCWILMVDFGIIMPSWVKERLKKR